MARKKTYYNPGDGQHYYHGESLGAAYWAAPESDKDESYINQYNYTPSYNAYRQYLEEEKRREEEERQRRSAIDIASAGAAITPHQPEQDIPEAVDLRGANAARTQRTVDRLKAEYDQEHNILNRLGLRKSEDLGKQADDIKVENYIPESVKANDKKTLNQLDQKINRGRTLTPDEEVQYSEAKLREYYKQYPGLEKLMTERNDYFSASNAIANGYESGSRSYRAYADSKRQLVEDQIKDLTGWSDEELKSVLMYANRAKNREDTQAESKRFEIDPNASRVDQLLKSASNTAYGLAVNRGTTNFGAWLDNRYSERPRGFGADLDSGAYRTINNANAATAQARQAVGRDAAKMGYVLGGEKVGKLANKGATWLYDTAYSSGDSMINQIPAIVAQAAASKVVGAQAGEVIGNAVGLVPYYFKSYNQGYEEARLKGATEEEANFSGITSGAIEVLTEILPMSNYIANKMGKNAAKGFVKTFVKQGIEEGMEELIGTLAEEAVDAFIYKDDDEVKSRFEQRVQETGSYAGAIGDLTLEMLSSFFSGAVSAAPSSASTQAMGIHSYGKMQQNIRDNASQIAQSIDGNTDYEKSVKAQMEQYAQNPTRYIADNLAENTDEDRQRKAEVLELAKKEANGEELTANEKLIVEEAMRESEESIKRQAEIDKKEGKTETKEDESKIPLEYRNKVSNLTEDEAREMLGKAANSGNADAFIDAMQMTMNSSHKSVSERATEIIGDYTGLAQDHGITAQAIGEARRSRLEAYKAGLNGEDLSGLSTKNQIAYNAGKKESILSKTRTTIEDGVLQNAKVHKNDGSAVDLKGVFTEDGIKTGDGETVKFEDIDKSDIDDSAVLKAYRNADSYANINAKNAYLANIKAGTNIDAYDETFKKMYNSALSGVSYENAKKSFTEADEDVLKAAYQVGETERKEKAFSTMRGALGFAARKGSGKVYIETDALSAEEADYASILARTMGVDIRVIDAMSNAKTRGSFDVNNSVITVEASEFKESLSHEMSEFMETYNKEGYDALKNAIANFSSERMGNDAYMGIVGDYSLRYAAAYEGTNVKNQDISADEMSGEMFNDIAFQILGSKKGQKAFAEYLAGHYEADEAKSIGQQLADRVKALAKTIKNVFGTPESKGIYAKEMAQYSKELGEYADQFIEALDVAIKNYKASAKIEAEEKLDEVSVMNGDTRAFSVKTYDTGGRDMLKDYLSNYSGLSKKDQKDILESLDWGYETAKKLAKSNKYSSFGEWSDTELTVAPDGTPMITVMGSNGKPLQSVAVSNGEYPLNIDFTQVCKKRIALNTVLNKLVSDADLNIRMLTESDVAGINRLIKDHGFEIACGLCFVDSKRYRIGSWATSFTDGKTDENGVHSYGWNELVNSMLKKGVSADYFNLAAVHTDPLGLHLSQADDKNINFKLIDKIIKPYIKTDKKGNQTIGQTKINGETANPTEEVRMAWLLKTNPEARHLLDHNDIIASEGLDKLRIVNPDVYALVNSHGGTSKPKLSHGFTAYGNEILRSGKWGKQKGWGKSNDFNAENAYEVGGVRVQSFSDYVPNMFFDYMQMFADMAARELPSHAYTKEQTYVKLFGMTGQRINMSLIFKGANLTEEQQARYDELAKNGVDAIKKDPEFKAMADHAGLDENGNYIYEDESFPAKVAYQLRKDPRYKNVGTIAVGLSDAHIRKLLADPQIDMVIPYHSSGVSQIIKVARNLALYTDYTDSQNTRYANGKKIKKGTDYDWYGHLKSEGNPNGMTLKETVDDYLAWCDENNYLPVFDQFRNEEGYWKLLIDFRSYDNDGNFMPQGKVTMTFPDNFEKIVKESLAEQQKTEDLMEAEMSPDQDTLYSEVKEFLGQSGAIAYSVKVDSEGKQLSEGQAEYFKDSKIVDENGNLKVMYHGTTEEFYAFDPKKFGGKNGTAEGFGIYLTDDPEVSDAYGGRVLKGYANVTHPAYSDRKTIKQADLVKLIKATAEKESQAMVDDGEYDSIDDAIKDSWVSNWEYTYDKPMDDVYNAVAQQIIRSNSGDMDIIRDVMGGLAIREYDQAYDFYETLQETMGIDGFVTDWKDKTGKPSKVAVVFNSNQFKNIDNLNPTENEDIRYSVKFEDSEYIDSQNNKVVGENLLDDLQRGRLEDSIIDYTKNPEKYSKSHDGNVIIPIEAIGGGNDKIAVISGDARHYSVERLYVFTDYVTDSDVATKIIIRGEANGEAITKLETFSRCIFGGQSIIGYVIDRNRAVGESSESGEGIDGFEDNEFGRNIPNREGFNSAISGEESSMDEGSKGNIKLSAKVDNWDHKLSADQIRYFKNSKIVDEEGRLKVMYHGTPEANFTIFDPEYSDDKASLFFTDSRFVAASYAGTEDAVDPSNLRRKGSIKTLEDLQKRFEDTDWAVREDGGEIVIENIDDPEDPIEMVREASVEDAYQEWVETYVWNGEEGEFGGLYEVYLNITNPLVIDANESNWEEIYPEEIVDEDAIHYDKIQVIKRNDDGTVVIDWALSGGNGGATETMNDEQFREKFGEGLYRKFIDQNRYLWMGDVIINPGGELVPRDTRGLSEYARLYGYDGLVINNLVDIGQYGRYDESAQIVIAFNSDQIKSIENKKPTSDPDIRYSVKVDSEGRILTDGQRKYFNNSKVVDDNGALKVMYHGARGAGFTVFDPQHSDDSRSLFFTDEPMVAKSYTGTYEKFKPLSLMTFDELESAMEGYTGGEIYLEEDGNDVVVKMVGILQEDDKEVYRGNLKGAQEYFIDSIKDLYHDTDAMYEVYLNLQNPYIIDAKGANWDELNQDVAWDKHFGDVEINKLYDSQYQEAGYEVEWMGQDFEWYHDTFKSLDDLENKFGKLYELSDQDEAFINDIYLDKDGNRIPTNTRMISQMAQEQGYDGVIIKNVYDVGMHASVKENVSSTIAIAFDPEQIKDVDNLNPTSSEDIRYSIGVDDDPFLDFSNYGTSEDAKAVDILREGMEALKNTEVDEGKVRQIANKLRREYGSSYNINELTNRLVKAFAYMQTEDHVDYKTMMGILKDIARPVIEASTEIEGKEDYKAFINAFKGYKIRLTDRQKAEVKHSLGSYGAYCRAMMPITISDNGTMTLDQLWDELVEKSGYKLDRDATEGDKALNLLDTLQSLRPTTRNTYGGDIEDVSKDLAMRIVEEYVGGEVSTKMQKQIKDFREKLKKDYDERLKKYEGRANARILARNKKKAEQAEERQKVRDLRQAIKVDAKKLMHWIEKPTEGKSVPHNMVMPVVEFLSAFDFVDPDIVMKEDGKWHVKVFDRLDRVNGKKKFVYKDISGATREEALAKFNEAIGRGEGSREQRFWAQRMSDIRDIYDRVQRDEDFEDNEMNAFLRTLDGDGLADDLKTILSNNKDSVNMNHLSSAELSVLNNIIKNIFHAVNQGNKAYTMNEDLAQMGRDTINDADGKEVKSRNKFFEGIYRTLRIDNSTPRTFFKLLGSRGIDAYKSLRNALNTEILDLKKASEFMEGIMEGIDKKEVAKWTGRSAVVHEFALSQGTIRMTDDQIMGLYLTIRRNGGRERIVGGIRPSTIRTKGVPIRQKAIHLTDTDIAKIESVLTPQQIELAKKMQKYMAEDCAKQCNATSRQMYGFNKFVDPTYYPWTVDRNTVPSRNTSEDVPMYTSIKNSGFTKALKPEANNPLVIKGIFDVFTEHVAGMATYHGYAASIQDVMRWLNYKTVTDEEGSNNKTHTTVKEAVDVLAGGAEGDGVRYIQNLILDINQANRSRYVGNFTDALIGNYKAAAVGANLRVVIQQPTAYFRALNMIDPKYLFAVNPSKAMKYIKISQEECPISWWKAKGYYETNLGQPLKEIVTGVASPMEEIKDKLMSPAGLADDVTWGFLYAAVENEQRDLLRGKGLSAEEFRKAVNARFDEVVDNTQVVDSTLHRSQYMRSTDRLNKIQTAFMAEPTKSYNMVMEALVEDLRDKSTKRTARAVAAFLLAALATSAAQSVMDGLRKNGDDDDWWEKFMEYVKNNFLDNINPFNMLPVVKDIAPDLFNAFTGESSFGKNTSRFDIDALSSISDAVSAWMKFAQGNGNKTPYGMVMATIKPISQVTGIPLYNLTRDAVSLYNAFFENIETTINKGSTAKTEQKKEVVSVVDKEKSEETIRETISQAVEHGVSIYDLKGGITSEYKNKYFNAYSEGDMDKAKEIANKAAGGFTVMGLSDEEIDEIINGWQEEAIAYSALDKAIADGKDIEKEIAHVQEGKADDKIVKHIMDRFASTVKYEDANNTESEWRENVEKALQAIDATYTFDSVLEEAEADAKEKAEKAAVEEKHKGMKQDFFDAVDKKDGSAGRKALEVMKDEGIEAKTVKAAVSTKYHEEWKEAKTQAEKDKAKSDWKSAYTLVNNVYKSSSNNLDQTWADWEKKQSE